MKNRLSAMILTALIVVAVIWGCSKEDNLNPENQSTTLSSVDFLILNDSIIETEDSLVVKLRFNRMASTDGHIFVKISGNAIHGEHFTTRPATVNGIITLELLKGKQSAQLTILRSGISQTEKAINLILENPTKGFKLGSQVSSSVLLKKKVGTIGSIDFSDVFIHISENESNGFQVNLNLSGSIAHTENVFIEMINPSGIMYGTQYLTNPAAVQNELKLEVVPGTNTVSFKILPVDNNVISGNYEILFKISATTGQLKKGTITELIIRVEEDDHVQSVVKTIAELRNKFSENAGEFWLGDNYYITGIITSGSNVSDNKTAYIQDNTGGIMLRFTIQNFLKLGDKVQINLKGSSGNIINGQKAIFNVHNMLGIKLDENQIVVPEVVSPDQLLSGNYEGKLVRINDVSFTNANGINVFEGNRPITTGTSGAIVTTYPSAQFRNNILPEGKLAVIGIVGDWGHILPRVYPYDIIR